MNLMVQSITRFFLIMPLAILAGGSAFSADWRPDKRIEIVVPNAPGGGNDRIVRLVQKIAQERKLIDPQTIITNKPGAGVVLGLTYLNTHPGDGHYIGIISATFTGDSISGRNTIGLNDLTPIAQLFTEYVAFGTRTNSPIKTAKDLVARLKVDTGTVSTAIAGGIGNHNYTALALLARAAGGDLKGLKAVVFNGGSEAITAAMGGHVELVISPAATLLPHVRAGTMRILAIGAPVRLPGPYASIPAWKELGVDAPLSNWRAIVGPRGLSLAQTAYWENVFSRVVDSDEWKKMLEENSLVSEFLRSGETRAQLKIEYEELKAIMVELGLAK
ncbi:MAG: tripartite tricarboxylate transporter substrate binding protein [Betaproteobacteria bacterium]